jgi:hypothetical protein
VDSESAETSRRPSSEQPRKSIESVRRDSRTSSLSRVEAVDSPTGGHDILADISALQREIDALRVQSEKERVT